MVKIKLMAGPNEHEWFLYYKARNKQWRVGAVLHTTEELRYWTHKYL